jgi:hypothetical protein
VSYLGISPTRLAQVIHAGIDPAAVRVLLRNNRTRLLMAGAKADNLPRSNEKIVDFLTSVPDRAFDVFRASAREQIPAPVITVEEAVSAVASTDSSSNQARYEGLKAIFYFLCSDPIPDLILSFLKPPSVPSTKATKELDTFRPRHSESFSESVELFTTQLLGTAPNQIAKLPATFAAIGAIVAARCGDDMLSTALAAAIGDCPPTALQVFNEALARAKLPQQDEHLLTASGLQLSSPITVDDIDGLDGEQLAVVGRCTKVLSNGQCFIDVIGYREGGRLYQLREEQTKQLFAESGDLVIFPGAENVRPPLPREFGVWSVQYRNNPHPTKYLATTLLNPIYEIINVPHLSTEVDRFRKWIADEYPQISVPRPVFKFLDGCMARPVGELSEFLRPDKDHLVDIWASAEACLWRGHALILNVIPSSDRRADFSDVSFATRELLRRHFDSGVEAKLTKAAIQEILRHIKTDKGGDVTNSRIRRVERELTAFLTATDEIEHVVDLLMEDWRVKEDLERRKLLKLEEISKENGSISEEIEKLNKQREILRADVVRLKDETKKQSGEVSKAIRKAFEGAKKDGVAALAQVALFQGIVGDSPPSISTAGPEPQNPAIGSPKAFGMKPSFADIQTSLANMGVRKPIARQLSLTIRLASEAGYIIAIRGSSSDLVTGEIAKGLSKTGVCVLDADVGLTSPTVVSMMSAECPVADVYFIRRANISAPELYLGPLVEAARHKVVHGRPNGVLAVDPTIVFSLVDGPISIPPGVQFTGASATFDLDHLEAEELKLSAADFYEDAARELADKKAFPTIWLQGLQRLLNGTENVDPLDQPFVLGFIKASIVRPFIGHF